MKVTNSTDSQQEERCPNCEGPYEDNGFGMCWECLEDKEGQEDQEDEG